MGEWFLNPVYNNSFVTVVGGTLLFLLFWLSRETRRISPARHWTLFAIRLVIFLLLIGIMFRPTLVISETKKQTSSIAVLIDRSRSMTVPDGVNGQSRWYELQTDLRTAAPQFAELGKNYELDFTVFDQESLSTGATLDSIPLDKEPAGKQTAIGGVLEDTLRRLSNKRLTAVILLSDGAQQAYPPRDQAPQIPARRLSAQGTPIYTFGYGKETSPAQSRDLAVTEFLVNPTVYVKNILSVTGVVRVAGFKGQNVNVQLLFENDAGKEEVVASTIIAADEPDQLVSIEMSFIPEIPGEHKLTLRAVTPDGVSETVTTNNQFSSYVVVLAGGINVLYLEGQIRVESHFLKNALNSSPDVNVVFRWVDYESSKGHSPPTNLSNEVIPGKYNCYIIGDLDSVAFRTEDLEAIVKNVERGAGLIMLGGYHSYWAGGYQNTPLARIMPLAIDEFEARTSRQTFGEPIRQDLHLPGPLMMVPDRDFSRSVSFLKLAPWDQNDKFWSRLPPLKGANKWHSLKRAANVLVRSQNKDPLVVAIESGQGRVLAFAGDSTWQWAMQGYSSTYKTFWRQALLWVLKIDETKQGSVWVKLDQRRILPGRRVDFTTGINGGDPESNKTARYTAQVTLPNGQTRTTIVASVEDVDNIQVGSYGETQEPGEYKLEVTADKDGKTIGTGKARFLVLQQDLEMDNSVARPSLLANLAQTTASVGGEALGRGQLPSLLEKIIKQPRKEEVLSQVKKTPWDSPWVFLLMVGLLCTEWYLRKRWGWV